jgi:hypothetical protein
MNERETRRYAMFGRVGTFGKDHAADFGAGSQAIARFAAIGRIIAALDQAKAGQQRGAATAKEVLLDSLRLDLQNITRSARAVAQDEPGFADNFRSVEGASYTTLLTAADAVLAELNKPGVAAKFIAHELPAELVTQLTEDRRAIVDAQAAKQSVDSAGVASTATVGTLIRDGLKEVTYLNAIMHNKYIHNPETLRAWRSACLIERTPRQSKKSAASATPSPTPSLSAPASAASEVLRPDSGGGRPGGGGPGRPDS